MTDICICICAALQAVQKFYDDIEKFNKQSCMQFVVQRSCPDLNPPNCVRVVNWERKASEVSEQKWVSNKPWI